MLSFDLFKRELLDVLRYEIFGMSAQRWLVALLVALTTRAALGLLRRALDGALGRALRKFPGQYDDAAIKTLASTRSWSLWAVSVYAATLALELPAGLSRGLSIAATTLVMAQAALWSQTFVREVVALRLGRIGEAEGSERASATAAAAITFISGLVVWTLVVLVTMQNVGIQIGALLTGLGIGGVAAALALQTVLSDLFASLSIYIDRPFDLGDFIVVGDYMGTVDKVGLRSTRLNGLGGEQLVLPNGDLMKSRVRNYRRMKERRVVSRIRVVYDTPCDVLHEIPSLLREAVSMRDRVRFDRAHFAGFGDSSLDFELVYYVLSADYNEFMDEQQHILFHIVRRFEERGISFALPTRTLHVHAAASAARNIYPSHPLSKEPS